jgi:ABC-2 type transport system permease protein
MGGVFASLKWRLVTSRLRAAKGAARVWMILLAVVLALFIGLAAFGLGALRLVPEFGTPILITLFTLLLVGWMITPLLAFGVDETVDPARFALLPIRPQTLQIGLLTTSLIGFFPLANLVILLGAAVGVSVPWSVLPVAVVCVILQLLLCVILSRAASTSMSALMSSRRGRDLGMGLGLVIFVLYLGFVTLLNNPNQGSGSALQSGVTGAASFLKWTPPGALASLPQQVATGDWAAAALSTVIALAGLGLAWWWWAVALRRSLTTVPSTTAGSSPAGKGHADKSIGVGVAGTARVVAGRDRVLVWRDPMRRMPWLMLIVLTVAWPFIVVQGRGAVFAVTFGALLCGAQAGNQYGVEGSGLWLHLQTITDRVRARGEVIGHAVTALIPGTVIVLFAIAVLAVVRDDYDKIPAAIGVCLGALLGATAAASYLSARLPYAQPQSRKSMFASSVPGQKGRTFAATLRLIGGGLLVALPAGIAAVLSLTVAPVWGWVALVLGPLCGALALWIAARMTADRFLDQATEIFAVVSAGDRV